MGEATFELPAQIGATCPACLGGRLQISPVEVTITGDPAHVRVEYSAKCEDCGLTVERHPSQRSFACVEVMKALVGLDLSNEAYEPSSFRRPVAG